MSKDALLYNLPKGWTWTTLGSLGIILSGGTPSTKEPQYWGGDIPWITPADLSDFTGKHISRGKRNLTELGLNFSSAVLLPKGSLIFSSRAPIGYIALAHNDLTTNQGFKNFVPVDSLHIEYIYYYLQSAKQLIQKMASGTTFLELSSTSFSKIPVPLPPLNEQYHIVEKLEELFSELEQSKKSLIKAQKQLKIYRQSFLKGILKESSIISEISTLDSKWKIKRTFLGDVVNQSSKKVSPIDNPDLKFIGLDSIEPGGLKPHLIHSFKDYSSMGNSFVKNNILYARMRPYLNKVFKAEFDGACSGEFIIMECKSVILEDYLKYILHSPDFVRYANEKSIGDRPRVSFEDLALFELYLPTIEDQQQIVNEIEYRFTIIENLEETIQSNLQRIELYRQSIFKKAFYGQLVPNDDTDNTADELLVKISEEKQIYLTEQSEMAKITPRMKQTKIPIIDIIKEIFPESEFTFRELRDHLHMSYDDIKEQFFLLLEKEDKIVSAFNYKQEQVVYKLKS